MWDFPLPIGNKFVYCSMRNLVNILVLFVTMFTFGQTTEELSMINEINKIRKDPKSYIPVVDEYIKKQEKIIGLISKSNVKSEKGVTIVNNKIRKAVELKRVLNRATSLGELTFNNDMYKITKNHCLYLDTTKTTDWHVGPDGKHCYNRFKNLGNTSENVSQNGDNVLLGLMLSDKHRENILGETVNYVSIYVGTNFTVQNFME